MSFQHKTPGETVVSRAEVVICMECGCVIGELGCDCGCRYDGEDERGRDPSMMIVRVWERTDRLIEERPYTRTPEPEPSGEKEIA